MEQRCLQFDSICKRIRAQYETDGSKAMELVFLDYAIKQYGCGTKQTRSGILDEGPEVFNELVIVVGLIQFEHTL
jgi:hypothetical protein